MHFSRSITEHKFLRPTHRETQQTKASELGAEMLYRRAEQEQVADACPNPGSPEEFQQSIFKGRVRAGRASQGV